MTTHPDPTDPEAADVAPPPGCPAHRTTANRVDFARATPLFGPGLDDMDTFYGTLRADHGPVAPVLLEPGVGAWLVLGYHALLEMLRDGHRFPRSPLNWTDLTAGVVAPDSGLRPMMAHRPNNVAFADGPDHQRLRRIVQDSLSAATTPRLRHDLHGTCDRVVDTFAGRGHADLIREYATVVPLHAFARVFGLPSGQDGEFARVMHALFDSQADSQAGDRAFEQILADLLDHRRAHPADDLTTWLLRSELRDEELLPQLVVMLSAGCETLANLIGSTLRLKLVDPSFAHSLTGGRRTVNQAIDEALVRYPPLRNFPGRYLAHDTTLAGRHLRAGDALLLGIGGAHTDPAIAPTNPADALGHGNGAHLAFGAGTHACPAVAQARLIAGIAVGTLLDRLPDLTCAVPPETLRLRPSPWSTALEALPARFTPAPTTGNP
ncbi:cytochrome P450 (plasmid) [Embleya sp. NBC_00888]|uniref:cytochrome P450 n=1 Tax=Embleya sp. NBC_00888 TaxID=2975960 RepID=UPI002F90B267|nr:cytochrome P450 [Embleya sp. NBC_00888]